MDRDGLMVVIGYLFAIVIIIPLMLMGITFIADCLHNVS